MSAPRWLPLESNPEVMNKYCAALGLKAAFAFNDVFGLETDLLAMVPRPVKAVVLLYPITEKSESCPIGSENSDSGLFFIKQTIGNACGTIGILHSLTNNKDCVSDDSSKFVAKFLKDTSGMTPEQRADYLEKSADLSNAHEEFAKEGQTEAPSRDEKVNLHFVSFVHHDGKLYELDGRKNQPMFHGATTPDTLIEDAAKVMKKFMERDPDSLQFSIVALCQN